MILSVLLRSSLIAGMLRGVLARSPPVPEDINVPTTSFLDHETPIKDFFGKTFLTENIRYIDIPDATIQEIYYFRFSSLQRHLRYTIAGTGYVLTEFCQPVGYSQAFDTINDAAGHQIDEARWYRSRFYDDDYTQIWTRGPGNNIQYTQWYQYAFWTRALLTGDAEFFASQLPGMLRIWDAWDFVFDASAGLYHFTPLFDAQESSLPDYVVGQNNLSLLLRGPNTYRPSMNGYMVGNAHGVAACAAAAGNTSVASNFSRIADALEDAMYQHLWNPTQEFFEDVIRPNNPNLTTVQGREEVGLFPVRGWS